MTMTSPDLKINPRVLYLSLGLFLLISVLYYNLTTRNSPDVPLQNKSEDEYLIYTGILNLQEFDSTLPSTTPRIIVFDKTGSILKEEGVSSSPLCVQPLLSSGYSYVLLNPSDPLRSGHVVINSADGTQNILRIQDNPHTDIHCPRELPSGDFLIPSYKIHTLPNGSMVQSFFIEKQDPEGAVQFIWDSIDHIATSSKNSTENRAYWLDKKINDYFHGNDIALANDGNLLISGRHTNQIIKIDEQTGDVLWKLGGQNSNFTFTSDPLEGFNHQHSVSQLTNGNILLYDNGNQHSPPMTRVVEYKIDEEAMTAELVWEYTDKRFTYAAGSVERLRNGNTLIGWGISKKHSADTPQIVEVTPDGIIVNAVYLKENEAIYGAYAFYKN